MMIPGTVLAVTAGGSSALWYLSRGTGLVALVLLSATVVLGMVASAGWTSERWPRFLSQTLHRNLSLFCIALVAIHVLTIVADPFVQTSLIAAVLPVGTSYRPLWVGLGALAFDLLLALVVTSGLRRVIGLRAWRSIHWVAYACWPIALLHGVGAGTDSKLPVVLALYAVCGAGVVAAAVWRVATGWLRTSTGDAVGTIHGTVPLPSGAPRRSQVGE